MKINIKPIFISSLTPVTKKSYNVYLLKKRNYPINKINTKNNILFKIKLKNYSGLRHQMKLPVRGQRTKTNAKTCKLRKKLKK